MIFNLNRTIKLWLHMPSYVKYEEFKINYAPVVNGNQKHFTFIC